MQRRDFLQTAAGAAVGAAVTAGATASTKSGANRFKLKYVPHFGMFKQHAGDDLRAVMRHGDVHPRSAGQKIVQ